MEAIDSTSLAARLDWEAKEYWLHLEALGPLEKYPAKQHAQRVQEKLGVDTGLIYLPGQPARNNEDSDMPAPFRQRRYFYYLSGCNEPSCHMTYDIQRDVLSLFIPRIDPARVIWNGRGSTLAEAIERYDIDDVYFIDELGDFIKSWAHSHHESHLYTLHSSQLPSIPGLRAAIDSESLQPAMKLARMIKDDHEIKLIRKANDISSQAHREVLANILSYKNEAQVEGLFMDVCISQQAKQQAYDPIAASGPNAGTLHYDANNEDFDDRQLMCLDAGCEFELYASDITRTFPLSAYWPSKEAESIYKLVERMQEACIERLAPGVRYLDLHVLAHQIAIDGLLSLGIFHNGTREEIYNAGTSRAFFPHGLGHHIGLEVHDVGQAELMSIRRGKATLQQAPSLYPKDFHQPIYDPETCHAPTDPQSSQLEEGMVVTVEPGIYFSSYALSHFYLPSPIHSKFINAEVVKRYLPVGGVRIEDDILITSNGYENLTMAPKGEAMLQIIRDGKSQDRSTVQTRPPPRSRRTDTVLPLLRAPGIPPQMSKSSMIPVPRASTMPAEYMQRNSTDFESYNGPSLFSNFRRSITTDEKIKYWKDSCRRTRPEKRQAVAKRLDPVCGDSSSNSKHIYIGDASCFGLGDDQAPPCKSCAILVQTLDRLRKNLSASEPGSPNLEQSPATKPTTPGSSPAAESKSHAAAESKSPEDWYRSSDSQQPRQNTQHTTNITSADKSPGARAVHGSLQTPGTGVLPAPRATRQQLIELAAERYQRLNHIEGVTRQVSGLKLTPRAAEQALGISSRAYGDKFKVSP